MTKILVLVLTICLLSKAHSQANDAEALLYNVSFGAVLGTIGAVINKKPEQKIGNVILKSAGQGALGGYLTFESKRLINLSYKNEDWKLIWCAKLVNAAGTSIKENAALNEKFLTRWHFNIGFNRIELNTEEKLRVRYKIMPVALTYIVSAFIIYDRFEVNQSLSTGEFVFSSNNLENSGAAAPGYFVTQTDFKNNYSVISHEIIHLYQSNDYSILNTYYVKPLNSLSQKSNFLKFLNDHLYIESHYMPLSALYHYETSTANSYYDNLFEHEAGYYSNSLH